MDDIDTLALAKRLQDASTYKNKGWEDMDAAATIIRHQVSRINALERLAENLQSGILYLNSLLEKYH